MTRDSLSSSSQPMPVGASFAGAGLALLVFYIVGAVFLDGFALDLGSTNFPALRYLIFVAFFALFGGLAAALLTLGLARAGGHPERFEALTEQWLAIPDRRFLIWTVLTALALPLLLRFAVLGGAPLTDDEGAYRFSAQLLASARLWAPSPELKIFFDQNFIINDGRMFSVYFLGWPALMVPGVWLGATWLVNPVCSALTVPALYGALRRLVEPGWARAGVLLFLAAPFVQIAAATELSNTSCWMALTWCLWTYLRTRSSDAGAFDHAGVALAFALAFFIRPQSALPIGLPILMAWALRIPQLQGRARSRAVLAFALPASLSASLFLLVQWVQNGSPWRVGYARYGQYLVDNDFRFATFRPEDLSLLPGFDFSQVAAALARTGAGLFRLNFDLFGWPSSFLFLLLAVPLLAKRNRLPWAMAGSYLVFHLFQADWGVDTFGPMHAFELGLPVLILTVLGAQALAHRLERLAPSGRSAWKLSALSPALLTALVMTAWIAFVPIRLAAIGRIAEHLNLALRAPAAAGLENAVVFSPWPFAPPCAGVPNHFVNFRPVNHPDLEAEVLWVNHLDLAKDRELLATLPGRVGYLLRWTPECEVDLVPLSELSEAEVRPGITRRPAGS